MEEAKHNGFDFEFKHNNFDFKTGEIVSEIILRFNAEHINEVSGNVASFLQAVTFLPQTVAQGFRKVADDIEETYGILGEDN